MKGDSWHMMVQHGECLVWPFPIPGHLWPWIGHSPAGNWSGHDPWLVSVGLLYFIFTMKKHWNLAIDRSISVYYPPFWDTKPHTVGILLMDIGGLYLFRIQAWVMNFEWFLQIGCWELPFPGFRTALLFLVVRKRLSGSKHCFLWWMQREAWTGFAMLWRNLVIWSMTSKRSKGPKSKSSYSVE